jgi:hypothetical protein
LLNRKKLGLKKRKLKKLQLDYQMFVVHASLLEIKNPHRRILNKTDASIWVADEESKKLIDDAL